MVLLRPQQEEEAAAADWLGRSRSDLLGVHIQAEPGLRPQRKPRRRENEGAYDSCIFLLGWLELRLSLTLFAIGRPSVALN